MYESTKKKNLYTKVFFVFSFFRAFVVAVLLA